MFEEYKWVEFANGSVQNRGNIVDIMRLDGLIPKENPRECYRGFYRYNSDFLNYVKKNHTVKGWNGEAYTDYIWIDIDDPNDLDKSLSRARTLVNRLRLEYSINDDIPIFFSGCKGFHVGLDSRYFGLSPSSGMPKTCKKIASFIANDLNIDTSIYEAVRLFRIENTINGKSGLYKIGLTDNELQKLSINQIKELAKTKRNVKLNIAEVSDGLLNDLAISLKEGNVSQPIRSTEGRINKINLNGTKLCFWRIMQGVEQGIRDECAIRLATDYAKKGMPAQIAYEYLKAWNNLNHPSLEDNEIKAKIASAFGSQVYDYGCNDDILKKFCHEDCFLFGDIEKKDDIIPIYQMVQLSEIYKEYVKNLDKKKILYPCLPKISKVMRGHRPGEVTTVLARPGIGKSLLGQSLLHFVANIQKVPGCMFSMEMPKELIFERGVSMEFEMETDEVEKAYVRNNYADIESHISLLNNIYYVDKCNLSLNDMRSILESIGNIGFVVIDYMSLIKGIGKDIYEQVSYIARRLKDFAKETNTAVFTICQVSRAGGDGTEPINLTHARDSGAIEEGADFVIGLWRDPTNQKEVIARLLKGRRGGIGETENMKLLGESVKFISTEDWRLENNENV